MKKLLTIFFISIVSSCCMAQDSLTIYLTYGTLLNDYSEKTFKSEERVWKIKNGQIIYFIDAHNKRYSDTLKISQGNYDTITECLKKIIFLKIKIDIKK